MKINKITFGKTMPNIMREKNNMPEKTHKLRNVLVASSLVLAAAGVAAIAISNKKQINLMNSLKNKVNVSESTKTVNSSSEVVSETVKQQITNANQTIQQVIRPRGWRLQSDDAKRLDALLHLKVMEEQEKTLKLRTSPGGIMVKAGDLKAAFGVPVEHIYQKSHEIILK